MANQRFTVYDVLESRGAFKTNPANAGSQSPTGEVLYNGPVQYPRMVYHPEGKERITVQAEVIATPVGPKSIGEQRELIHRIVKNEEEEIEALKEGWHLHPADAIRASGKEAPATGAEMTLAEVKRQIEQLQRQQMALEQRSKPIQINPMAKP
jgi:hypothetical protein